MKNVIFIFLFLVSTVFGHSNNEPKSGKHPNLAAWLGLVPGLGHLYINEYSKAATHFGFFTAGSMFTSYYASQSDYIETDNRKVKFDYMEYMLGYEFRKRDMIYNQKYTYFVESDSDRMIRLLSNKQIAEVNPLIRYGEYERYNTTSMKADMASRFVLSTMFYSSYAAYRDAGGISGKAETLDDLLVAPFQFKTMSDPMVFLPLIGLALGVGLSKDNSVVLVDSSLKQNRGLQGFYTVYESANAAVSEEAFFRGFLNRSLSKSVGPVWGGLISGTVFGLAHLESGMSAQNVLPQILSGYYFAYLQYLNQGDITKPVALHFWWDVIVFFASLKTLKADPNYQKEQYEVNFMPITYTLKFF